MVRTPRIETRHGDTELLYTSAVLQKDGGLALFCLNIGEAPLAVSLDLRSFGPVRMKERVCLCGSDLSAANTFENPFAVTPKPAVCPSAPSEQFAEEVPGRSFYCVPFFR